MYKGGVIFMDKRKIILIIVSIIIIALAFSILNKEEAVIESPISIEVGQIFTGIEYSKPKYVLNYKISDINGDTVNDVVIFVGEKEDVAAIAVKNADVVLYDGALGKYINVNLKKFDGDTPRIELADLTGDSLNEIVVILNNSDGNKIIRVIALASENLKEIFKAKDNNYINFTGNFVDGFKVNLNNRKLNINKELDLKNNSEKLIENGVFDKSGKYLDKSDFKIKTTNFTEVEFVQLTGSMGIQTKQRIITNDNQNIIDEISIIWKYEEGKWQIKEAKGIRLGNLLY